MSIEPEIFNNIAILATVTFVAMSAGTILRLPPIISYVVIGVVIGLFGLGDLNENLAATVADLGIVFLMFVLGLEFNVGNLFAMRRFVRGLGTMQLFITMLIFTVPAYFFTNSVITATLVGFAFAMSSTAVVSQILMKEKLLVSPTGRRSMGVLLFQDLAVFPIVAFYAHGIDSDGWAMVTDSALLLLTLFVKGLLFLFLAFKFGKRVISWFLQKAEEDSHTEVFVIILVCLLLFISWLSKFVGLPDIFGAFLIGILLSDAAHKHKIESSIEPIKHITLSFFFIHIGLFIAPEFIFNNFLLIVMLALAVIITKLLVVRFFLIFFHTHPYSAWHSAFLLSGCGEFGFILLSLGHYHNIIANEHLQILLAINLLSMLVIPLIHDNFYKFLNRARHRDNRRQDAALAARNAKLTSGFKNHVIIGGFGYTGQNLTKLLTDLNIPCLAIEKDYALIEGVGSGINITVANVVHGEYQHKKVLLSVGILQAKMLVLPSFEGKDTLLTIKQGKEVNPNIFILATANTAEAAKQLYEVGADKVLINPVEVGGVYFRECIEHLMESPSDKRAKLEESEQLLAEIRQLKHDKYLGYYLGSHQSDAHNIFVGFRVGQFYDSKYLFDENNKITIIKWLRNGEDISGNPNKAVKTGDILVIAGNPFKIIKAREKLTHPVRPIFDIFKSEDKHE